MNEQRPPFLIDFKYPYIAKPKYYVETSVLADDPTRLAPEGIAHAWLKLRDALLDTGPFRLAEWCVARLNRILTRRSRGRPGTPDNH